MSAGRFFRARPCRAAPAASGFTLSRPLGSLRAGVSSSQPAGRGYMAREGGGREEESLGALLSPPPGGGARQALLCLTPPRPARPPACSLRARPSPAAAASAPHPSGPAVGVLGGCEEEVGILLLPPQRGPQHWAAAAGAPPLPNTRSRPSLPAGYPGRRRRRADRAGDNCQLEVPLGRGRGEEGEGQGEKGVGTQATLQLWGERWKEAKKDTVAIHGAHA